MTSASPRRDLHAFRLYWGISPSLRPPRYSSKIPEPATQLLPSFLPFLLSFPSFFPCFFPLRGEIGEGEKGREGKERGRREKGRCTDHGSLTLEAVWLFPWLVFERSNYSNEGAPRFYVHHKERHIAGVTGKRGASRCSFFRPRIERLRLGYEERDGYTRGFRAGWLRLWEFISARARHDEKKNVWMGQRFIVGGGRIESCL